MKSIKAFAPATIANFNVGYDVLGVSLNNIGDTVELAFNGTSENRIIAIQNGENLPKEVQKNCCSVVIRKIQESLQVFQGVDIRITKGFASGSGMGSSSASSAAAAFGYNMLVGQPFSKKELVAFAAEGERVACGSPHLDNVASSLLGGITLVQGRNTNHLIELPVLDNLYIVSLLPDIQIKTSDSRKILKDSVSLDVACKQVGLMGAFVSSLYEKNVERFSHSLQDLLVENMRSPFIPLFDEMKQSALNHGSLAFGISGSGPAVFALTQGEDSAQHIRDILKGVYEKIDVEAVTYVNALSQTSGARIL